MAKNNKSKHETPQKDNAKGKEVQNLNTARHKSGTASQQFTPGHHASKSMTSRGKISMTPRSHREPPSVSDAILQ